MVPNKSREWLTHIGVLVSRPAAFVLFAIYGAAWIVLGDGLEWHQFATLATWGMTLVIQRAEHRETPTTATSDFGSAPTVSSKNSIFIGCSAETGITDVIKPRTETRMAGMV